MRRILIVSCLLLLATLPLAAQSLTGTVTGEVKDQQGGALPGVTVTLTGKTGARTAVTDADGAFRFAAVDPGSYSVTAALTGFRSKRQENVSVNLGRVSDIRFSLAVGGVTDSILVVGEARSWTWPRARPTTRCHSR